MRRVTAFVLLSSIVGRADAQCLTTLFAANGGTSVGGAVYFDVDASRAVLVEAMESNFLAPAGTPVGLEVPLRSGTSVGLESSPAGWTLVARDDGTSVSGGWDVPTPIVLDPPARITAGLSGVGLVAIGSGHARTNGTATNILHTDGTLTLRLGASSNVPFAGTTFQPRVWNGTLCYRPVLGDAVCSPAVPNSTGAPASIVASGSASVADDDVRLTALGVPPGALVLGLASRATANVPMPGGSQGTLCLGGSIGRFVQQAAAASPGGTAVIDVDLAAVPTPTGLVAVQPGESWSFQAWYRDANPGPTSNTSDGLRVTFCR